VPHPTAATLGSVRFTAKPTQWEGKRPGSATAGQCAAPLFDPWGKSGVDAGRRAALAAGVGAELRQVRRTRRKLGT